MPVRVAGNGLMIGGEGLVREAQVIAIHALVCKCLRQAIQLWWWYRRVRHLHTQKVRRQDERVLRVRR